MRATAAGAASRADRRPGRAGLARISRPSAGPSQPRVKAKAATRVRAEARADQPFGPQPAFHQALGGEFLDDRQDVAAGPVAARAARGDQQPPLETGGFSGAVGEQGAGERSSPTGTRTAPAWTARRSRVDCRSQSPSIAAVAPRVWPSTSATPAQRDDRVDPLELGMRLVVGNGGDGRLGGLGHAGNQRHVGRAAVGDQQDQRSRLEPARGLIAVADRDQIDALAAQPLERVVERRRECARP